MLRALFSGDYPRSKPLTILLIAVMVMLALAPFLFPGKLAYEAFTKICVFVILVASYDLLLGYTAIVSFGHAMFYGIGAYAMAITLNKMGGGWDAVLAGLALGLAVTFGVSLAVGLLSLRVKAIFFAMVTLAIAAASIEGVKKFRDFTGGEDGMNVDHVPTMLTRDFKFADSLPGFDIFSMEMFSVAGNGRLLMYYLIFFAMIIILLMMLRIVNSPFGRVLQAIRENEFRTEAIGYRTVYYRTINNVLAALFASTAGSLLALSTMYVAPETVLGFNVMVNLLLMVVIGGVGTIYGAVIGSTIFILAETYLQKLMPHDPGSAVTNVVVKYFTSMISDERWLLWLGVLFVLSVYFFPFGFVGQFRIWAARRKAKQLESSAA